MSENISGSDSEYDYDYDIWGDYAYTDDKSEQSHNSSFYEKEHQEIRINFAKYGPKNESKKEDREINLPKDIYCHLVDSLNEKCGQQSLLEIWRYDPHLIATSTKEVSYFFLLITRIYNVWRQFKPAQLSLNQNQFESVPPLLYAL